MKFKRYGQKEAHFVGRADLPLGLASNEGLDEAATRGKQPRNCADRADLSCTFTPLIPMG
jgi:hypothetical protein